MARSRPERLGKVIAEVLELAGLSRPMLLGGIRKAWQEIAGQELSSHTEVQGFRAGRVHIQVDSAARRWELQNFQGQTLLVGLRERLSGLYVKELCFH